MEGENMTTRKALTVVLVLIFLTSLSFVVPSSLVGGKSPTVKPLFLKDPSQFALLKGDSNRNNSPDWQDLLLSGASTSTLEGAKKIKVTDEDRARLLDPNNLTASFSKNLYTASLYAKKNGNLTEAEQSALVKSLIEQEAKKVLVKTYAVSDLSVSSIDTEEIKKNYGNKLGEIFLQSRKDKIGSGDIAIIQAYNINKDPGPLATLRIKKNKLDSLVRSLLQISVPPSAVVYHLRLINALSQYKTTVDSLSQIDTDPIKASLAFREYGTLNATLLSSLKSIQLYFNVENVTFTKNEPGFLITSVYTSK